MLIAPALNGTGEVVFDTDNTHHNVLSAAANDLSIGAAMTVRTGTGGGDIQALELAKSLAAA